MAPAGHLLLAVVTAFFARRCFDPQTVADLTAETFVAAIGSLATFDVGKGSVIPGRKVNLNAMLQLA